MKKTYKFSDPAAVTTLLMWYKHHPHVILKTGEVYDDCSIAVYSHDKGTHTFGISPSGFIGLAVVDSSEIESLTLTRFTLPGAQGREDIEFIH